MKPRMLKVEKTEPKEVIDVRDGKEERNRVERLMKNENFAKGSKYLPNGAKANEYRYARKQQGLLA